MASTQRRCGSELDPDLHPVVLQLRRVDRRGQLRSECSGERDRGGFSGQIAFSRDGGVTWTERSVIPDTGFYPRIEPVYAPSIPGLLYAVANDYAQEPPGQQAGRLFRSLDGGANWLLVSQPGHLLGQEAMPMQSGWIPITRRTWWSADSD